MTPPTLSRTPPLALPEEGPPRLEARDPPANLARRAEAEAELRHRGGVPERVSRPLAASDAEAELRYRKALLESQNEASVDGILIVDAESRVVSVNRRFVEMWGVDGELLRVGGNDEQALRSVLDKLADPDEFLAKIEWLFDHPDAKTRDEVRFRDGRVFERWSTPVYGPEGTSYGRGWYFRDVTERRHQEAQLRAAYDQLKEHEAARTRLINTICHDLGTPLTPIRVQVHMLQDGSHGPLLPDQEGAVAMIQRNLDHLQRLVEDMRDVGRIQAGRLNLQLGPVRVGAVLDFALETFAKTAEERGVALRIHGGDATVRADPQRIGQVVFNLVSNALKFTPRGGTVTLRVEPLVGGVRVHVEDTGRGLVQEEMERLFQPFSQVHEPAEVRTQDRGSGLGLYISKSIVEQHGGTLTVASDGPGRGSSFTFHLPSVPPSEAATRPR